MPPVKFNATIYILTVTSGEYEDTQTDVVGVITDKTKAEAFVQAGIFKPDVSYGMEVATLNVMDGHLHDEISRFLSPKENPMCECGHRLLHHRGGKKHSCKYNSDQAFNKHKCPGFRLAMEKLGPRRALALEVSRG